jgi:Dioxygenase
MEGLPVIRALSRQAAANRPHKKSFLRAAGCTARRSALFFSFANRRRRVRPKNHFHLALRRRRILAATTEENETMEPERLTRRELLLKSAALGSLTVIPTLSFDEALWAWHQSEQKPRKPTAWDEIGPFYKRQAPQSVQLRRPGDPGLPVRVSGKVFDTRGNVLSGAKIEIWQANHLGLYDLDGYGYRTTLL